MGNPDYMGVNAFDNIRAKLDEAIYGREWVTMNHNNHNDPGIAVYSHDRQIQHFYPKEEEDYDGDDETNWPIPEDSRHSWEIGRPDYWGSASFDNILRRIHKSIGGRPKRPQQRPKRPDSSHETSEEKSTSSSQLVTEESGIVLDNNDEMLKEEEEELVEDDDDANQSQQRQVGKMKSAQTHTGLTVDTVPVLYTFLFPSCT